MPDPEDAEGGPLTSRGRRELFLRLAATDGGTTVGDVYQQAVALGDSATEEAYFNIARRLVHTSHLVAQATPGGRTRYVRAGERWLEEGDLADLIDPDYPVLALTVWREAVQQVNDVPESVWIELRERLQAEDARSLFLAAIQSYCDDFDAQIALLAGADERDSTELVRARKEAEQSHRLLVRLTKYGLGLSAEAVRLPGSVDLAISDYRAGQSPVRLNGAQLELELARRVEAGPFIKQVPMEPEPANREPRPLVGGVDGSSRGGLLSIAGQDGDFQVAHAPLISINTAVGQVNRTLKVGGRTQATFTRLPHRPEDMQRDDNRHTIMAKLLHPDLTDAQYMHAVWNSMDLVETKAALRLLRRWYVEGQNNVEVPPAGVVLRDGTASPQDRDFSHYKEQSSYGRIVRDLIEMSWEVALACREDERVVCGVVKQSQLSTYGPVLNWYAARVAADPRSQLKAWPLLSMNVAADQLLMTRLLTAGRRKNDPWSRTAVVLRPFHALTNFGTSYNLALPPGDRILADHQRAIQDLDTLDQDDRVFWGNFQGERDSFVKMLRGVQYGSVFLAAVPRLDKENMLPRLEVLVPSSTDERDPLPWPAVDGAMSKTIEGISEVGFDVAAEHSMFSTELKLDVLPRILITTHEIVKTWALELVGRVQEYVGYHLARYVKGKRLKGVQVRPFTRGELEALYSQLRAERERQAGAQRLQP